MTCFSLTAIDVDNNTDGSVYYDNGDVCGISDGDDLEDFLATRSFTRVTYEAV